MKQTHLPPCLAIGALSALGATGLFAAEITITGADLVASPPSPTNTWTSPDSKLTFTAWDDEAKSIPGALGYNNTFIGINGGANNVAVDSNTTDSEQLELTLAADAGLKSITANFNTAAGITNISGFAFNPGVVFVPNPNTTAAIETGNATYDDATGTVTINFNLNINSNISEIKFLQPAASAGQTLTISRPNSGSDRQTAIRSYTYETDLDSSFQVIGIEEFAPTLSTNSATTADGKITVEGWADQTQTTPATFGIAGGYFFGIAGGGNDNAVNGAESVTVDVAPDASVSLISLAWPSATGSIEISGFSADPLATFDANTVDGENGTVSYNAGTLTVSPTRFNGQQRLVTFDNPSATLGQTLVLQRAGATGQFSLNYIGYFDSLPPAAPIITGPLTDPFNPVADTQADLSVILDANTSPAPTYLWEYDDGLGGGFVAAPGDNTSPIYLFTAGTATDGTYRVTVTNSEGSDSSTTTVTSTDDGDGINNQWEIDNFGDHLLFDETDDVDTEDGTLGGTASPDGRNNFQEWTDGTDPLDPDTDGDGLDDGDEVANNSNPLVIDTDGDGFSDGYEVNIAVPATLPDDASSTPGVDDGRTSIAINFDTTNGENPNNTLGPDMFAGAPGFSQKNWNSTSAQAPGTVFVSEFDIATPTAATLVDNSGTTTSAGFTMDASGIFSITNTPQIPYGRLYSAYFFDSDDVPFLTFELVDVPYARYDVVVYPMGFSGNTRGYLKENGSGKEFAVRTSPRVNDGDDPVWYQSSDQSNRTSGDFENFPQTTHVIFRGLSGDSSFTLERVLDNVGIAAIQIIEDPDTDGDGMGDNYEISVGLDPNDDGSTDPLQAPGADFDNDTISNIDEHDAGTNPTSDDTDNDGFTDDVETDTGVWVSLSDTGTDPRIADFDGDGLLDGVETNTGIFVDANDTGGNPLVADFDTDQDGWSNAYEQGAGATDFLNPNDPGGPNPAGFAVSFNASVGTTDAAESTDFLANTHAGAPGVEMKNWNRTADLPNAAINGTIANYGGTLVDSSGAVIGDGVSGVDIAFTAGGGVYSSNPEQNSPYGRLFNSFIYGQSASATNSTVTLTGIPYATYDVYVYFGSETNGRFGTVTSTSAATTYSFTTGVNNTNPGSYTQTTDTGSGNPVANYAVFSGQSGGTFDVAVEVGALQNSMGIYGVQVVDTSGGLSPYDAWAAANISDSGERLPTDDADGDGTENLGEYAFFTDPDDSSSFPDIQSAVSGGDLTLTYDRAKAASGITYIAEASTDLVTWSTAGVTDTPTGTEDADIAEYVATVAQGGDPAKFLRIRVTQP